MKLSNSATWGVGFIFFILSFVSVEEEANALPAFALRERVSCTMCHTNGSAPHLTPFGYMYRRAGFRNPWDIGNREADNKAMTFQEHMAVGVNVDYEYSRNTPGAGNGTTTANQISVREVEVWPLVGGFNGNFGVWSEIDSSPQTTGGGSINLSQADLRYVTGTEKFFFNFRAGMMATEGFGASDQWLDDANIPVMDQLTAYYNQDTLTVPFGAMATPQLGAEFGLNYMGSHLTVGIYNGFSGINSTGTGTTALTAALQKQQHGVDKDYKFQLDQFIGDIGAITGAYYNGSIQLMDPTGNTFPWTDHYTQERLYFTYFVIPGKVDLMTGGSLATTQFVTTAPSPAGSFDSRGVFFGANYYVMPHLTVGARTDFHQFNNRADSRARAIGYSAQISSPFENNIFILHFNRTNSDLASGPISAGRTDDIRLEWRFLF